MTMQSISNPLTSAILKLTNIMRNSVFKSPAC